MSKRRHNKKKSNKLKIYKPSKYSRGGLTIAEFNYLLSLIENKKRSKIIVLK